MVEQPNHSHTLRFYDLLNAAEWWLVKQGVGNISYQPFFIY